MSRTIIAAFVFIAFLSGSALVYRISGQDYCVSSCAGNNGCASHEAYETDWCMYPDTGCPSPGGTFINGCCYWASPIIIDLSGHGFELTSAADGVLFDFFGTGRSQKISWTRANVQNAWLVLDRNGNGQIENGAEVFGNMTSQPKGAVAGRNGFKALGVFDLPDQGGNQDGVISNKDSVYHRLKLWIDANHNGVSEPEELHSLLEGGVSAISLDYKESRFVDGFGNRFKYRAKVHGIDASDMGKWAYDVFLLHQ